MRFYAFLCVYGRPGCWACMDAGQQGRMQTLSAFLLVNLEFLGPGPKSSKFVLAVLAKPRSEIDRSDRDLYFDNGDSQKSLQIHPKTPSNHSKIYFQTFDSFFNHFPLPPPIPPPPKSRSQPGISFSGADSSKSPVPYQKVSKVPSHPIFPRFTNKKPGRPLIWR